MRFCSTKYTIQLIFHYAHFPNQCGMSRVAMISAPFVLCTLKLGILTQPAELDALGEIGLSNHQLHLSLGYGIYNGANPGQRACFLERIKSSTSQPKACCPVRYMSQLPPGSSHELETHCTSSASRSSPGAGRIRNCLDCRSSHHARIGG